MKLLNLFLILAITLTAFGIAQAGPTYTAYSVDNIQRTVRTVNGTVDGRQASVYTATVNVVTGRAMSKAPIWSSGTVISIGTRDCDHVPGKDETGIIVYGPRRWSLLFSDGTTCTVYVIDHGSYFRK